MKCAQAIVASLEIALVVLVMSIAQPVMAAEQEVLISEAKAREIMGTNFFGVKEAGKHFGVEPSKEQIAVLAKIPWTEGVLRASKDTHVLVAVFPLSLIDIRERSLKSESRRSLFGQSLWYEKQAFATNKGKVGWQLVRKGQVKDSTSKSWKEQQAALSMDEETPRVQVLAYAVVGYYLNTGEDLFEISNLRCNDLDDTLGNSRIYLHFWPGHGGLWVHSWFDDETYGRSDVVGVSATKKQ